MSTDLPKTRAEAKRLGVLRYFPGSQCCYGHVSERYTPSGNCMACTTERAAGTFDPAKRLDSHLDRLDGENLRPEFTVLPETADDARRSGSRYYFTGKACQHGHLDKRQTQSRGCMACMRLREQAHYRRNQKKRVAMRGDPEKRRRRHKKWCRENAGLINAKNMLRRASKTLRTPKWLTPDQLQAIRSTYLEASRISRATGVPHEVDHIVPLHGRRVSGLHVPWNLQIITAAQNRRKYNRLETR